MLNWVLLHSVSRGLPDCSSRLLGSSCRVASKQSQFGKGSGCVRTGKGLEIPAPIVPDAAWIDQQTQVKSSLNLHPGSAICLEFKARSLYPRSLEQFVAVGSLHAAQLLCLNHVFFQPTSTLNLDSNTQNPQLPKPNNKEHKANAPRTVEPDPTPQLRPVFMAWG